MVAKTSLEILTLNAWGIKGPWPIGSADRQIRIDAIATCLSTTSADVVALQEIWSTDDFRLIRQRVQQALPSSHYFYSGFLGSGVCVFTKGKIVEVLTHRFSLNGYAHHVHRGDWFGGKVVGLTKIKFENLDKPVHFYSTHVHAEYNRANDTYLPHRLVQALELGQFVKSTSRSDDLVFLAGDFNFESSDLGYRLVVSIAELRDSWLERPPTEENETSDGCTCDTRSNCYTPVVNDQKKVVPKRIDYILFKSSTAFRIKVEQCSTAMGRIPQLPFVNYSDHEAVHARYKLDPIELAASVTRLPSVTRSRDLAESIKFVEDEIVKLNYNRKLCTVVTVVLCLFLFFIFNIEVWYPTTLFICLAVLARFALTLSIGFYFWFGIIILKTEENALMEAKAEMKIMMANEE